MPDVTAPGLSQPYVAQDTEPQNTSVLWVDTSSLTHRVKFFDGNAWEAVTRYETETVVTESITANDTVDGTIYENTFSGSKVTVEATGNHDQNNTFDQPFKTQLVVNGTTVIELDAENLTSNTTKEYDSGPLDGEATVKIQEVTDEQTASVLDTHTYNLTVREYE